nr:MAG TPA: hypothetical protein [Caudoviricetes sp.]
MVVARHGRRATTTHHHTHILRRGLLWHAVAPDTDHAKLREVPYSPI